MEEIWKDIEGYEGLYQVSNLGRVRSLARLSTRPNPRTGKPMTYMLKERILSGKNHSAGYFSIHLYKYGKGKMFLLHRLVAMAFVPNPNNLPEVNHKDEDKRNNRADNLEWCTQSYNVNYGSGVQRMTDSVRSKCKRLGQYDKEGNLIATFTTSIEAANVTGIGRSSISNAITRKGSSGGYRWRYAED
jgi:hypothetical protein